MALTETPSVLKATSSYPELSVKTEHLNEDETFKDEHFISSPVKVMASPNYFSMKGPFRFSFYEEHRLTFASHS